ncbi:DNA polymerase I [Accumulibacter sp.]|uniref:DNA polymerase I n=1 Tax=Accumulibacter sp. TaxID=2053492 RepID=UPI0025E637F0|nr:DNA polymerase I [Accumulibacter sp.]MCM8593934.1 DNA polymerase I [Accumulibacter sp.]MCM8627783.1 DNA polymerase I [Accumulibacter sp.]MDS4048075.1 DNA polymerase I [Accumulibacter sp.]
MPMLLLVDGSSYLYRAFHALPDLRTTRSEPTGAIHGVLNMLRRLENDYQAGGITLKACVFDAPGRTFRDEWYPEYKANRPPMPDDLVRQIEPLHAAIAALGWPLLIERGVEADDVIATLATRAAARGICVIVSTGDKDLAQLVGPHVTLVNTMSGEVLDEAGVVARFGVPASQIVDYLTLVGDPVDNVPGVAKVGPKTAAKWLNEYGSLDGLCAAAAGIGGAVGESLRRSLDFLPVARRLVTVRRDLDLPVAPEDLVPRPVDRQRLGELFTHYEMRSWLRELQQGQQGADEKDAGAGPATILQRQPAEQSDCAHRQAYTTILDRPSLDEWLGKIGASPLTALDTETTSLDPFAARLVGFSLAVAPGEAAYLPLAHDYPGAPQQLPAGEVLMLLKPWLESAAHAKVGQNLKYDQHVLANHGIRLAGVRHDTLLQSYVLESGKEGVRGHDLGQLAERHLGLPAIAYETLCGKGASQIGFAQVDIERAAEYAAEDADLCLRLHHALHPQILADSGLTRVYEEIEIPVREVLFLMERTGVLIDAELLVRQSHEIGQRLVELERRAHAAAGQPFNVNSPRQLAEILFERLGLPVKKKTPSGTPSTDEEVLSELALDYPLPKILLEARQLAKLKGTYTDKLPKMVNPATGRVHTSYAQAVAVTGRLASSEPNLQNIPVRTSEGRRIRAAFIAPPGCRIVSADYSQIELRIMAHLSEDERLLDAFARGEDVHRATAAEIFGVRPAEVGPDQRRVAKVINFGLIYGMSAFGLARQLDLERGAAQAYIERYFARYPGVRAYMERTREQARSRGYVETVFGRRLWLPEIRSGQTARRQAAERAAINAPMQGSAADLIKSAMIATQRWLDSDRLHSRLLMQVHDELVLEVPEGELSGVRSELPRLMSAVASLRVPLVVDVGDGANWDEAH